MKRNPYRIEGPASVSFSGGRTSAFMLRKILDAYRNKLPDDIHVTFANTGKERAETLDFVKKVQDEWKVRVRWLEYRPNEWREPTELAEVTYETAARNGEPFAALIEKRGYVPGPRLRFCTEQLKIIVIKNFMWRLNGYETWTNVLGLRADEPERVAKIRATNNNNQRWDVTCPMYDAGHTVEHVTRFWKKQRFDLGLESYQGNCDLCFLKARHKIERSIRSARNRGARIGGSSRRRRRASPFAWACP